MIPLIEENDIEFTKIWSEEKKQDDGILFVNKNFPNDVFFNKLTNITSLSNKLLTSSLSYFKKNNTKPFIYVDNPKIELYLEQKKFQLYDTQHVLVKTPDTRYEHDQVYCIKKEDSMLWADVFCKSYDCMEWINEVNYIVRNSVSDVEYLVDSKNNVSCVALFRTDSILGLYCLGTIPEQRKKGHARLLINYALNQILEKKLDFLMLETYASDNLLKFYSNLGFQDMYEKKIYTI